MQHLQALALILRKIEAGLNALTCTIKKQSPKKGGKANTRIHPYFFRYIKGIILGFKIWEVTGKISATYPQN